MDYRKIVSAQLFTLIQSVKTSGKEREVLINDLAKIAIWHSIKDGQVTPAAKLAAALGRTDAAKQVVDYMQMYGNIGYGKLKDSNAKGIKHVKRQEQGEEQADAVYFSLPDIWDEFPNEPSELKDYKFHDGLVRMALAMRERLENGKQVICANDEETALMHNILTLIQPKQMA